MNRLLLGTFALLSLAGPAALAQTLYVPSGTSGIGSSSSSNVGIGTSTPLTNLTAVGGVASSSTAAPGSTTNYAELLATSSKAQLYLVRSVNGWSDTWWEFTHDSDNSLKLGFSAVPQAQFKNGTATFFGNVSIGTTNPTAALQVAKDATFQAVFSGLTNPNKVLQLGYNTSGNYSMIVSSTAGSSWDPLALQPSGGNVGIGTTNPAAVFQVAADATFQGLFTGRTNTNKQLALGYNTTGNYSMIVSSTAGSSWDPLILQPSGGNVGIGTTSPAGKLDIAGSTVYAWDTSGQFNIRDASNNAKLLALGYDGSANVGYIQSIFSGSTRTPLTLQPNGGNVGIGTTNPTYPLSVNGTIEAKEVIVQTGWSDYVFQSDYRLAPLAEVQQSIQKEGHLPGIPSAREVAAHGVSVGDMQAKLLAKIEELTLHQIAQEKREERLEQRIVQLEQENAALRAAPGTQ